MPQGLDVMRGPVQDRYRYAGSPYEGFAGAGGTSLTTANDDPRQLFTPSGAGATGGGGGLPFGGGDSVPLGGVTPGQNPALFQPQNIAGTNVTGAEALGGGGLPAWLSRLLPANAARSLGPLIAALMSGGGGSGSEGLDLPFLERAYEDARAQNAMQQARYRRVDPLHEAVTQLAFSRLPTASRQGIEMPRVPLPGGGG